MLKRGYIGFSLEVNKCQSFWGRKYLLSQTCLLYTTFRDLIPISAESKSWKKLLAVIGHMTSLITYKDSSCARSCMLNQKSYYVCLSLVVVAVEVISNLATTCWRQLVVFALTLSVQCGQILEEKPHSSLIVISCTKYCLLGIWKNRTFLFALQW